MNVLSATDAWPGVAVLTRAEARRWVGRLQELRMVTTDMKARERIEAEIHDLQPAVDPERAYEACK